MICILVAGMPASGKTTLARKLSDKLHIPMVSKDEIKELFYDTVGFTSREGKIALGMGSMEAMYYFAGQLLRVGQSVILENNFEECSKTGIEELLARYGCKAVTIRLEGSLEMMYERFVTREKSQDRHRGHVVNDCYPERAGRKEDIPPMSYETYVRTFTERGMADFAAGDELLRVDVSDFTYAKEEALIKRIRERIEECSDEPGI